MGTGPVNLHSIRTCIACPEQYDVYLGDDEEPIGYIRLRWGHLRADYLPTDTTVYSHNFNEEYKGEFSNEKERRQYLQRCYDAIKLAHKESQ